MTSPSATTSTPRRDCRAVEEARVKVGRTFLSALLKILLPECSQKKALRRQYTNDYCKEIPLWGIIRIR